MHALIYFLNLVCKLCHNSDKTIEHLYFMVSLNVWGVRLEISHLSQSSPWDLLQPAVKYIVCCTLFSQFCFNILVEVHSESTNFTSKILEWKFCILHNLKLLGADHATPYPHKGYCFWCLDWNVWFTQKISYICSLKILSLKEFFLVLLSWEVSLVRWQKKPSSHASLLSVLLEIKIQVGSCPQIMSLDKTAELHFCHWESCAPINQGSTCSTRLKSGV